MHLHANRLSIAVGLFLIFATGAVFCRVLEHDFVFDDKPYVLLNEHVKTGISLENLKWAFTSFYSANWHPLTWVFHMLDCMLFGLKPAGHHLVNLMFHIVNSLLLFGLLSKITESQWKSAFVAVLFALHPLHVESVVWIAEKKDVLSTFFFLLTILAYIRYVRNPIFSRYALVVVFFILGLMSKPIVVTLPFVLLLLDYWPLGRVSSSIPSYSSSTKRAASMGWLFFEKVPLLILAISSCVITYIAQQKGGAVGSFEQYSFGIRTANAVLSYVNYIGKMFWPRNLAVFYPHPGNSIATWQVVLAMLAIFAISLVAVFTRRTKPFLITGWLWYLSTLIPVIGFVQVGGQAMADRYTYIPLIGLFIMIAWGVPDLVGYLRFKGKQGERLKGRLSYYFASNVLPLVVGISVGVIMFSTWVQVSYWQDSISLYRHAVAVTHGNWLMHNNLGVALAAEGRYSEAICHYLAAIRAKPEYADAHTNMGNALSKLGRFNEAISEYQKAISLNPTNALAHYNLGAILAGLGRFDEATAEFAKAVSINPNLQAAQQALEMLRKRQVNPDGK